MYLLFTTIVKVNYKITLRDVVKYIPTFMSKNREEKGDNKKITIKRLTNEKYESKISLTLNKV